MKDNLFKNIESHISNVKNNSENIVAFNKTILENLHLSETINIEDSTLIDYKYFKTIKNKEIYILRSVINNNNYTVDHINWSNSILRFLEFRYSALETRLKKNYTSKKDKCLFFQNVVSLLLEHYKIINDERFLSLALKMLRKTHFSKVGLFNSTTLPQYSYNILLANQLTSKIL